jgi:hypothetical protein
MTRKTLSLVRQRVCELPVVKTRIERWHRANKRAEALLRRVALRFEKKNVLKPRDYSGLVKPDDVLDLGDGTYVPMTVVMSYYAEHWHPLMNNEDVDFFGPPERVQELYDAYSRSQAIDLYKRHFREGKIQ